MFEFEPGLILWTSVSFALLVYLLYSYALPKIIEVLKQREGEIAASLAAAERTKQEAAQILAEQQKTLAAAREQSKRILSAAGAEGKKLQKDLLEQAERNAAVLLEKARVEIRQQQAKIISEVKKETAELITLAAGKLIRRNLTPEDHHRLVDEALKELKNERG